MGRVMSVDYGSRRVGIALSDTLGLTASGYETIRWNGKDDSLLLERMIQIIKEKNVTEVVFGLPRRTDNKQSESQERAETLAASLEERVGICPVYIDERYTTVIASRYLIETGASRQKKKDVIDQVAAEIILREYLETKRNKKLPERQKPIKED